MGVRQERLKRHLRRSENRQHSIRLILISLINPIIPPIIAGESTAFIAVSTTAIIAVGRVIRSEIDY